MVFSLRLPVCLVGLFLLVAPARAQAQGTVVLTGKVSGTTKDTIAVSVRENPLDPKETFTYARLNEKGEFRLALTVPGPTRAELVYGDGAVDLFLEPGDELDARFKGNALSTTVRFKGKGEAANNYLMEANDKFVENDGFQVLPDNITFYEPAFVSFLNYRRKEEQKFLDRYAAGVTLTPAFKEFAQAEIVYSDANDRLTFQDLREQVVATEGRLKLSATYYDFLKDPALLNNPNPAGLRSGMYQEFLLNYVHYVAASQHPRTDPRFYQVCYDVAKTQLSGPVRPLIMARILQESFRFGHVRHSTALLTDFQTVDTKNEYYPTLLHDFETHKAFSIGSPAPEFRLATVTGDSVSLRDFVGKLVYLNFWRTTSGMSLRDLPYAQELAKRFSGKDIVFLNVALDDNETSWKQMVINRKMPGVHVRATGGLQSAIARAYALQEVPSYFLLAEDGTFLNTKPKRLGSHAAIDEIKESFGKAATYTSTLAEPAVTVSQ